MPLNVRRIGLASLSIFTSILLSIILWGLIGWFLVRFGSYSGSMQSLMIFLSFVLNIGMLFLLPMFVISVVTRKMLHSIKESIFSNTVVFIVFVLILTPFIFNDFFPALERREYCASLRSNAPDGCITFLENSRVILIYPATLIYFAILSVLNSLIGTFLVWRRKLKGKKATEGE